MIGRHAWASLLLVLLALAASAYAAPDPVVPPNVTGQQWSMVVIPDPQAYTQNYGQAGYLYDGRYDKQTDWIARNVKSLNIRFVSIVGDDVQRWGGISGEWERAVRAINILHDQQDPDRPALVPYAVAIGNHDYDRNDPNSFASTLFEKYLGPGRFRDPAGGIKSNVRDWYRGDDLGWNYVVGGKTLATGVGRNSYQTFHAADREFLSLNLEMAVSDEAIAWARTILAANPGKPTILTTHAFLDKAGRYLPAPSYGLQSAGPNPTNDAASVFDKLVAPNDQIFLVLCGHIAGHAHSVVKNAAGHDVHIFLQCYHMTYAGGRVANREAPPGGWPSGYQGPDDTERSGAGWLTLLIFDPAAGTITHYTYSPLLDIWAPNRPRDPHARPDGTDNVWWNRTFPEGDDVFQVIPFDFQARFPTPR